MLTLIKYRNNQKGPSCNLLSTVSKFFLSKSDPDWETEVDRIEGGKTGRGPPPSSFFSHAQFRRFFSPLRRRERGGGGGKRKIPFLLFYHRDLETGRVLVASHECSIPNSTPWLSVSGCFRFRSDTFFCFSPLPALLRYSHIPGKRKEEDGREWRLWEKIPSNRRFSSRRRRRNGNVDSIAILIWENEVCAAFKGSLGRNFDSLTLSIRRKVSFEKTFIKFTHTFANTHYQVSTNYTLLTFKCKIRRNSAKLSQLFFIMCLRTIEKRKEPFQIFVL